MGIMRCENQSCNAVMAAGESKCPACGKKTYFYLKHPQPVFILLLCIVLSPIVLAIGLIISCFAVPFLLIDGIRNKIKYNNIDS